MESYLEKHFLTSTNLNEAKDIFDKVVSLGLQFKTRETPLVLKTFQELYSQIDEKLPNQGTDINDLLEFLGTDVLPHSTNYASPYAMAFPDAGNSLAGLAGAVMADFLNQNLINFVPCAPMATVIEVVVLKWLRELVGYKATKDGPVLPKEVGGIVTSGGVASNTIAALVAREKEFSGTMKNGVGNIPLNTYVCVVPDGIEHYSSRLCFGWLGLGEQNVVKVATRNFRYDLDKLENTLVNLSQTGKKVIMLTAYAGDSRSMTCDNFVALRKICDRFNMWLHVDGCHGTQLLFSDKLKSKTNGIELADSITFDPHKVLALPYTISIVLFKHPTDLDLIQRPEDIITGEEHSFGQVTPFFGSRSFVSLKLYMMMKHMGKQGISELIEHRCQMAKMLADMINEADDFILVNPNVESNSVIFLYAPYENADVERLNELNTQIQNSLLSKGQIWLHNFSIPDLSNVMGLGTSVVLRPLRYMSGNAIVTEDHLKIMLSKIRQEGKLIWPEIRERVQDKEKASTGISSGYDTESNDSLSLSEVEHISFRNSCNREGRAKKPLKLMKRCEAQERISEITQIIREFCSGEFTRESEDFYVFIYGSYAYGMPQSSSDLDIMFVAQNVTPERQKRVIDFIIGIHHKFDMRVANEVPFDKKALVAFKTIENACAGAGVLNTEGKWKFDKIVKDPIFLASDRLLLRFLLGMMTNPHVFVDGSHKTYLSHRTWATRNLIRAVLSVRNIQQTSSTELVKMFCISPSGEEGDFYLGFSYDEPFKSYLATYLESVLSCWKHPFGGGRFGAVYRFANEELISVGKVEDL